MKLNDIGANLRFLGYQVASNMREETLEIIISELQTETLRLERVIKGLEKILNHPLPVEAKKRLIEQQEKDQELLAREL